MSFGFSVGEFLKAIELANKARARFVDAPDQFRAISTEVKNLSNVLRDIDDVLPHRDLPDQRTTELGEIVQECQDTLTDLEQLLDKFQELDSSTTGFPGRSKRVWKRLRWDQNDIDKFRTRITSNVLTFNTFLQRMNNETTLATYEKIDRLANHQDDQNRQAIVAWITPVDYVTQQNDFISRRQKGTGQWLLESNEFQSWVDQRSQVLFCHGIPGAGKTMSAAIVIDALSAKFRNDIDVGIAYIYCNFRRQDEQTPLHLFSSLLKQLIQKLPAIPDYIQTLYNEHKRQQSPLSLEEIAQALQSTLSEYSRSFIVVDALDECQTSDRGRKEVATELINLQTKTGANLFITSRSIPDIEKELEGRCVRLTIRACYEDLKLYLDGNMKKLPSFVSRNLELQEAIICAITKAVDGMFLLAQLHLDSLIGKRSPKAIRVALEKLPKGSGAYDQAYSEAMQRIEGQVGDAQLLAKEVLSWITCAEWPLEVSELQHALAVEVGEHELDLENLPQIEDIISVCAGLVTVDEESGIVRLVHYTTQEFLERNQGFWFPSAHKDITTACITYLSFDTFDSGPVKTLRRLKKRVRSNPFYNYAAQNWGHHARKASTVKNQAIIDFLNNKSKVEASTQPLLAAEGLYIRLFKCRRCRVKVATGLHLAARFGLEHETEALLNSRNDSLGINSVDYRRRTPLSRAAGQGHNGVVQLLLDNGASLEIVDDHWRTPLLWAAANGREATVSLLLERSADPTVRSLKHLDALQEAALHGHEGVVRLLVKGVIDVNREINQKRALHHAIAGGFERVVELLVENGANVNAICSSGQAPLEMAASMGKAAMVDFLLDNGANVATKSSYGTALHQAAEYGRIEVMRRLIVRGADVHATGGMYCTVLQAAAYQGSEPAIRILLDQGARVNDTGGHYGTALHAAAYQGHESIVQLLLDRGAGVDITAGHYSTALIAAASQGKDDVIRLLIDRGADVSFNGGYYGTALHAAARHDHLRTVKLLLKEHVDPDSRDREGLTPLSWAARQSHVGIVIFLATKGVDVNSTDNNGRTALSWAAMRSYKQNKNERVMRWLVNISDIDLNSRDATGRTALSWAAGDGNEEAVKVLLSKDNIDPNIVDIYGHTALWWARRRGGNDDVVNMILDSLKGTLQKEHQNKWSFELVV